MASFPNDPGHPDIHHGQLTTSPPDAAGHDPHHSGDGGANSDEHEHEHDDEGGKRKKGSKRRKVNHACLYCRRSHMTCDEGRPCQRCIKREIGHLCHDERRPAVKEKERSEGPQTNTTSQTNPPVEVAKALPGKQLHRASRIRTSLFDLAVVGWPSVNVAPSNYLYQPETLGNEFSVLSDFLESLDEGSFFSSAVPNLMSASPYTNPVTLGVDNTYMTDAQQPQAPASNGNDRPEQPQSDEPAPVVLPAATKTERFFLTAADQGSGTRNERLNMVIRSKYEAGLLKPYNYVKGYARLSRWMDKNVSQDSKAKILQPLSVLRPKFRAIAQSESLTDIDLVFIEEAFERLLLDYDRVFSAMGVPACLWRRTGEIYKANREFAELVGVDGYMLRDGRMCIYELMAEDSAVNYWELTLLNRSQKYGHVAFDSNQKAVLTSCVLRYKPQLPMLTRSNNNNSNNNNNNNNNNKAQEEGVRSCCFSFTIRRDPYGIPTLIVGNFIKC
ncbi:hypothetical protein EUX98_g7778 [Antrodiella citrinella]|uniref:Zn(2)-C6 fungal-type domain-containing protein n=1 Tax=Antrodiella citrinella TaxID=2447956 RepID=A0A4V3XHS2_9APHY|nr:hypothetical protein EUX98_g7778 [Antrodiella citrinella]